jgi:hypothetical protein
VNSSSTTPPAGDRSVANDASVTACSEEVGEVEVVVAVVDMGEPC